MGDQLPGVNKPARIEITEGDLGPAHPAPPAPARASAPPATHASALPQPDLPSLTGARPPARQEPKQPALGAYCAACGSPIHARAVVCPHCGVATAGAAQATGAAMTVALNSKSTGVAILLSLFFTGAGQWYVGRVGRGFAFLGAAILSGILILAVVGVILLPIVWVWAAIDANKCAQEYNARLMAQVGVPVPQATLNG
jgi:TM2 domain-containing membrane protein YozV